MRIDQEIEQLARDGWNREHIRKHAVTVDEVEEAVSRRRSRGATYTGRPQLTGSTGEGASWR